MNMLPFLNMKSGYAPMTGLMFFLTTLLQFLSELGDLSPIQILLMKIKDRLSSRVTIKFNELGQDCFWHRNNDYFSAKTYLSSIAPDRARRLVAYRGKATTSFSMDDYEKLDDVFEGVNVTWVYWIRRQKNNHIDRWYSLTFKQKYRKFIMEKYLDHVRETARIIDLKNRKKKLFTNSTSDDGAWTSVVFKHPASFETLAMEAGKKEEIIKDLEVFSKSKDYYSKMGKAWKRGYLLYGPPGTGKSTMIASIANLLDYDIYDLELTAVKSNTELRKLLTNTGNKAVLVIEDIDCSLDITGDRKSKDKSKKEGKKKKNDGNVTLSGLLNFIDGLWSGCAEERIVVFTTNHVKKLDPALIRRGRMDMHIELSYCSYDGFKVLAKNYLGLESHNLFEEIRELLDGVTITPADVAEQLLCKTPDQAEERLKELIELLKCRKSEEGREEKENTEEEEGSSCSESDS